MLKFVLLCVAFAATSLFAGGNCQKLNVAKTCSNVNTTGQLISFTIEPCTETPCVVQRSKNYTTEISFIAKVKCDNVTATVFFGISGSGSTQEEDICKDLTISGGEDLGCPTHETRQMVYKHTSTMVQDIAPGLTLNGRIQFVCLPTKQIILCSTFDVKVA